MTWLFLWFALEIGYQPTAEWQIYTDPVSESFDCVQTALYTELDARVYLFDYFFVGGSVYTVANPSQTSFSFKPKKASYTFVLGGRYENEDAALEVGFRYTCIHPVLCQLLYLDALNPMLTGQYNELYVRVERKR